ncbi:MAG: (2Fe-2S)-binding protein [Spirochaetia bacterium]|jgi:aerobic-type carbon monoxide dehydrogenase small subunit (CoxS/CutS family)|nr:(2Fe-2S)-binding protein [Spirochaetia bacterium]
MNKITVNGKAHEIPDSDLEMSLMDFLKNKLDLTGTKNGCNIGVCGACTVLIDGSSKRACIVKLNKAITKKIITIEGMEAADGSLHPIQQAFIDCGAIQCGFCTPGMVMSTYALLLQEKEPSREKIKKALAGNLCRCTGYQQIIDAVESAAEIMRSI